MSEELATKVTLNLLRITAAVWVTWDVFVLTKYGVKPSISVVLREILYENPFVCFMLGVVAGHIIWVDLPLKLLPNQLPPTE